jgi:uncharacterized low-complexity protein
MNNTKKTIALAISGAFALSIATTSVTAAENPFAAKTLSSGYQVADNDVKTKDGKCSTGKCSASKKAAMKKAEEEKTKEGNCSAERMKNGKMKEGDCSAEMKKEMSDKASQAK